MKSQRGAAILTAMLTVALVSIMASSMLWQQWRGVEVETAQRIRVQSAWILTGALDWARLILREDAREGGIDHLGEPWAVPLAPAHLSTFLAAEQGQSLVGEDADADQEAFLSGHILDLQARLNVTNLVVGNKLDEPSWAAWLRLFNYLNLPESELESFGQGLLRSQLKASDVLPGESWPLPPQTVAELHWLGLSQNTVQILEPFIIVLPERTPINLNTAPPEVLLASVAGLDMAQARALVQARASYPMTTLADAARLVKNSQIRFETGTHELRSRFFKVTGQLRLGSTTVQQVSVMQRDGLDVKILSRSREIVAAALPTLQ